MRIHFGERKPQLVMSVAAMAAARAREKRAANSVVVQQDGNGYRVMGLLDAWARQRRRSAQTHPGKRGKRARR